MEKQGAALIIGAGISGIQSGLDLAEAGYKVYMVERTSSIGGRMAQLDKTFPTNDCAMCTLAPKMVEVTRHPDIQLLMTSEVTKVEGESGNFTVTVKKNPRFIDENTCTGCGLCGEVCPILVPNEFDTDLGSRKAAYIPFPQASPLIYTIDKEHCIDCGLCQTVCEAGAVDHQQEEKEITLEVGSIITSTGYDLFDPSALDEYGFGRYPNVLTNLQFERLLNASGPTGGHIVRPSNGAEPKKVAFIQCVGSRDVKNYPYCSQICCMASTKEAIIAGEHAPGLESSIFYMDLRAFGKGFQEYVNKAKDQYGVKYIRSRPSQILENPDNNNPIIIYEDTLTGEMRQEEFDMVVLASALKPSAGAKDLAETLGLDHDDFGYFTESSPAAPYSTKRDGIYITGACVSPRDIPDSVGLASGTASSVEEDLQEVRNTQLTKAVEVPEKDIEGEEERIGVYVCHCGLNIASVINCKEVAEYAANLPGVAFATDPMYSCSDDNQVKIKADIEKHNLNRVIVTACTPRTHEPLFRATCKEAGLNPYLFEMGNIREHSSWVHSKEPVKATEKAKDLVKMAVARAKLLEPLQGNEVPVTQKASVVGGGAAGMTAALSIARQGFEVDLIEKGDALGGALKDMNSVFIEGMDAGVLLDSMKSAVESHDKITIHRNSTLKDLRGFTGNFEMTITEDGSDKTFQTGAIVVAIGTEEHKPEGMYLYGSSNNVITQGELEQQLKDDSYNADTTVMIQCVGARDEERPFCARNCCNEAVKNAMILRKRKPGGKVFVLFRDMMTFGKFEDFYRTSQEELGVKYVRYSPDEPPKVEEVDGKLMITAKDALMGSDLVFAADKVVLSTPQIPPEGMEDVQKILKVPRSTDGFFMEAHAKLRPLEFTSDGIFLCGQAQFPKELPAVIAQAAGSGSKAASLLAKGVIETIASTSSVQEELCIGCGRCVETCMFSAISLSENEKGEVKAYVNEALCKGCGSCSSVCPNSAIIASHFKKDQYIAMIEELLEEA